MKKAMKKEIKKSRSDICMNQVDMVDKNVGVEIPTKVRITCDAAPLYLGDSDKKYSAVGAIRQGEVVSVAGVSLETGWYAVRVPRYILWVDNSMCEAVDSEESSETREE